MQEETKTIIMFLHGVPSKKCPALIGAIMEWKEEEAPEAVGKIAAVKRDEVGRYVQCDGDTKYLEG